MKKLIAPSILSADFARLGQEINAVEKAGADWIHIDVMDGHFVPDITIGSQVVAALRKTTNLPLDVHLMIEQPENFIDKFVNAGSDVLTVHVEASGHLHRLVEKIKSHGIKAGVSLNPVTSLAQIEQILGDIDLLLIMSVNPGFGGQDFIPSSVEKIATAKVMRESRGARFLIEVDGGIKIENIGKIADAGADVLVAGSAIFSSLDYARTIDAMRQHTS